MKWLTESTNLRIEPLHNEAGLLQQLAHDGIDAFREIYSAYMEQVHAVSMTFLKRPDLAEDVVQSVFLKVWEHRAELPQLGSFTSWLFILARNTMISTLRLQTREEKYIRFLRERTDAYNDFPEGQLEKKEIRQLINKAVEQLTPQQRTAFILHRHEGLSYEAIGQRMGIATNTVRKHLHQALQSVRAFIKANASEAVVVILCPYYFF